jgi:RNA polymerase sigma factor (sigma-70 family)
MKQELEFKGFDPTPGIRSLIERQIERLDRKSQSLPGDVLFLRCAVEEVPVRKLTRVTVVLVVPQNTLAAKEEAHDAEAAVQSAFQEIEKQLEAYKSSLRGEHWWKRVERRWELKLQRAGVAAGAASEDPQWFFKLVEPHLAKLREVGGRVLNYVEARGDLPPNDLELDDVVDAALARAYDEFSKERAPEDIRSRLIRFALDEIKAEVKRAKTDRTRAVHLEERVPKTPPTEEVSTLGDEILDFYQPDEELKVEDVVPDLEIPRPDQTAETNELRRCVRAALRGLPQDARRALTLRYIVGLHGTELAKSLGKREADVKRLIDDALMSLREKLVASGCTFKASGPAVVRS